MNIKSRISETITAVKKSITNDRTRRKFQFFCIYFVLGMVSAVMTVLNVITEKGLLTIATLLFSVICFVMAFLMFKRKISLPVSEVVFVLAVYALFIYFIISGNPDGFSILWLTLLPACGMFLFGKKYGSIASLGLYVIIIFLLEIPAGRALLQYEYSETFTQRFPLLYMAFYAVGLSLETIRYATYQELEKLREKYRFQSCHDALTGVYNRQGFNELMDKIIEEHRGNFLLVILDLDRFKDINDKYGHLQGDKVLVSIAKKLEETVGESGKVCRWGGEEFAVMVENCENGRELAEKIRLEIGKTEILTEEGATFVTASVGGALVLDEHATAQKIVNAADRCLYQAKEEGRNKVVFLEI